MKNNRYIVIGAALFLAFFTSCGNKEKTEESHQEEEAYEAGEGHEEENVLELSKEQIAQLGIELGSLEKRPIPKYVEANGKLEVPPQYEATVTASLGVNVQRINVIEGDQVEKGQVLAWVSHPNIINLQTAYIEAYNDMVFKEQEYDRQKRLYDAGVSSGKEIQRSQAAYQSALGLSKGYESQLRHLNVSPDKIKNGTIVDAVSIVAPIKGYVEEVGVNLGQYVNPQDELFSIVDNDHVHADLMVFEKDVFQVKEGQPIDFTVQSIPGKHLKGEIRSIGKQFETSPKAVHVHAEIENKGENLIPGMYINGRIQTGEETAYALPEAAIVENENKSIIFMGEKAEENGKEIWKFTPVEVETGISFDGWTEIHLADSIPGGTKFSYNRAFDLIAEMKKGSTSHSH
ncbi:efflux RND transporter periplasmic adaptor subunit [Galbibacter pacificus]|uniref:Efflux RND transporter periplasmic adaptor subunit n=1 Tax=Galbibacter pacificus TaxID=2996052 RepID=A0ABT6FRJ3_9FLAO|nr:efflux RND transporter periplasmic adaptor subunit [Galbibacter pacificus]MDG3581800.1 efflux RND transporter periplasmic adaptor subunit [Galbibacter pacificus]MDG3585726.1 efflux RND transporter periplasmic adaptor subunit [Galbibacter pacificus]